MGPWRHIASGFARGREGSAVVELAALLPCLMLVGLGAADSAILLHQSHRVEQGLELAGSYLSKTETPSSHYSQARQLALTGDTSGGSARVSGWQAADITITERGVSGTYRNGARIVRLESSHTYQSPLGFLETALGRDLTVRGVFEVRLG